MKTWVYRHSNEAGELLYVGVSNDPMMRTRTHEKGTDWFDEVKRIDVESFPTREEALEAEAHAIIALNPRYNRSVVVNGRVIRVHFFDQLRQDYLAIRPAVLELVGRLGVKPAAKEIGLSEATIFRICMGNESTPARKSITKIEGYLNAKDGA